MKNSSYKCDYCNFTTKKSGRMERHLKQVHKRSNDTFSFGLLLGITLTVWLVIIAVAIVLMIGSNNASQINPPYPIGNIVSVESHTAVYGTSWQSFILQLNNNNVPIVYGLFPPSAISKGALVCYNPEVGTYFISSTKTPPNTIYHTDQNYSYLCT